MTIRLSNGERVDAGEFSDEASAKQEAKAIMMQVAAAADADDWPYVSGRFLKPDTIVSVDIAEDDGRELELLGGARASSGPPRGRGGPASASSTIDRVGDGDVLQVRLPLLEGLEHPADAVPVGLGVAGREPGEGVRRRAAERRPRARRTAPPRALRLAVRPRTSSARRAE